MDSDASAAQMPLNGLHCTGSTGTNNAVWSITGNITDIRAFTPNKSNKH